MLINRTATYAGLRALDLQTGNLFVFQVSANSICTKCRRHAPGLMLVKAAYSPNPMPANLCLNCVNFKSLEYAD